MDNQTADLLKQLASKLGTTAQNLWNILLHQAPISATIGLIISAILIIFPIVLYKVHLRLLKEDGDRYSGYENNDAYPIIMGILAFGALVGIIFVVCNIENILNGYFNPQYWALEKILDTLKSSK